MKPFNLEEALSGKPVQTRDGHKVTLLPNFRIKNEYYTLAAVIHYDDHDVFLTFAPNGAYTVSRGDNAYDLFMTTEKREVWINIYPDCGTTGHPTKEAADKSAADDRITCAKIEYEE